MLPILDFTTARYHVDSARYDVDFPKVLSKPPLGRVEFCCKKLFLSTGGVTSISHSQEKKAVNI